MDDISLANRLAYKLTLRVKANSVLFCIENPEDCHDTITTARIVVQTCGEVDLCKLRTLDLSGFHSVLVCLEAAGRSIQQKEQEEKGPVKENILCCICMERRADTLLPCVHAFCGECIAEWKARNSSCPMCRDADSGDGFVMLEGPDDDEMVEMLYDAVLSMEDVDDKCAAGK